ncbi:hypothetical protein FB45DRAFT_1050836 [Roridomyces roridus]|uniref:Uncharacterized protein n=1 Tax=Roridomyces roridus TaxID=1738132 RepID=A0AAD7CKD1_9AGAR|nr:hypothetical protein FB45DRAFT_1050836 [Roridomyces roridus]
MFLPWRETSFSAENKSSKKLQLSERLQDGVLAQMYHPNFKPSHMPPIRSASTPIAHSLDRSNYFGGLFAFNTLVREVLHMLPGLQDPGSEHYLLVLRTLRSPQTCARMLQATGIYAGPLLGIEAEVLMRYFGMYMASASTNGEDGFDRLTPWFVHAYQPLAFVASQEIMHELAVKAPKKKKKVAVVKKESGEPSTSKDKENKDPAGTGTMDPRKASVTVRKASKRHAPYPSSPRPIQVVAQYSTTLRPSFYPGMPLQLIRSGPPPPFPGPLIFPPAPCPEFSKAERTKLIASFDPLTPMVSEASIFCCPGASSSSVLRAPSEPAVSAASALYTSNSLPPSLRAIINPPSAVAQSAQPVGPISL